MCLPMLRSGFVVVERDALEHSFAPVGIFSFVGGLSQRRLGSGFLLCKELVSDGQTSVAVLRHVVVSAAQASVAVSGLCGPGTCTAKPVSSAKAPAK